MRNHQLELENKSLNEKVSGLLQKQSQQIPHYHLASDIDITSRLVPIGTSTPMPKQSQETSERGKTLINSHNRNRISNLLTSIKQSSTPFGHQDRNLKTALDENVINNKRYAKVNIGITPDDKFDKSAFITSVKRNAIVQDRRIVASTPVNENLAPVRSNFNSGIKDKNDSNDGDDDGFEITNIMEASNSNRQDMVIDNKNGMYSTSRHFRFNQNTVDNTLYHNSNNNNNIGETNNGVAKIKQNARSYTYDDKGFLQVTNQGKDPRRRALDNNFTTKRNYTQIDERLNLQRQDPNLNHINSTVKIRRTENTNTTTTTNNNTPVYKSTIKKSGLGGIRPGSSPIGPGRVNPNFPIIQASAAYKEKKPTKLIITGSSSPFKRMYSRGSSVADSRGVASRNINNGYQQQQQQQLNKGW